MGYLKTASNSPDTAALLEAIRSEDPSNWPDGLSVNHYDPDNLWTIHHKQGNVVGFAGWQAYREGHQKIGYYSIGILPEYRRQGIARQALSSLIRVKAASVDEVRAYIAKSNLPSQQLAESLGVKVKAANLGLLRMLRKFPLRTTSPLLSGTAASAGTDALMYGDSGLTRNLLNRAQGKQPTEVPLEVKVDAILNFIGGAVARKAGLRQGRAQRNLGRLEKQFDAQRFSPSPVGAPALMQMGSRVEKAQKAVRQALLAKRVGLYGIPATTTAGILSRTLHAIPVEARKAREQASEHTGALREMASEAMDKLEQKSPGLAQTLPWLAGALAIGASGYGITKALNRQADTPTNVQVDQNLGGRIRVTLPTKNPDDAETVLDLPFEKDVNLSTAQQKRMAIDVRRRLRAESGQRRQNKGYPVLQSVV